jgi:ABC-type ATPase involved in cell division
MIVDEPTTGVEDLERDPILELLRSLTEDGTAVLMSLDKGIGLFASNRALALSHGRLRGHLARDLAPVVELPLRSSG